MSDVYILLKDLPDTKAGTIYCPTESGSWYSYHRSDGKGSLINAIHVEDNPEWFEKKNTKHPISRLGYMNDHIIKSAKTVLENFGYKAFAIPDDPRNGFFWSNYDGTHNDGPIKKEEPESVEEKAYSKEATAEDYKRFERIKKGKLQIEKQEDSSKKYSIQDMEECFNQARLSEIKNTFLGQMKIWEHKDFNEYMNTKK